MIRFGMFLAALLAVTTSRAQAGELDSEYGRKDSASPSPARATLSIPMSGRLEYRTSSELDGEAPAQSWRRGGFGFGGFGRFGGGFGRFGGGFGRFGGFGYPRFWGNRGFGFGGFGGFGFGGYGLGGFGGYGLGGFGGYGLTYVPVSYGYGGCW